MSRLDVVKSLLRSAARSTSQQLGRIGGNIAGGIAIRDRLAALLGHRLLITDRQLTAAVARIPEVSAATVSSGEGILRVDATFRDGSDLLLTLTPLRSAFAPRGAKELSMRADPDGASYNPRAGDIAAAIATEVAHALWGPFLRKQSSARRAIAERHGNLLVVDMRTVPAVRAALAQPLLAAGLDAIGLESVNATPQGLRVVASLPGLEALTR
jgi:uncharacterized protein YoaH (UPF0181 family)